MRKSIFITGSSSSGGSGTSAGTTLDIQFAGAGNTFDADTGQLTVDKTNHRLCVNWSGGSCDTGVKYGPGTLQYTGAFGNGKTISDGNNHRFFTDEGTWTPTVTGKGAASFAAALTISGALGVDHHAGFESVQVVGVTTLPLALLYGFFDSPTIQAGATVTTRRGLNISAVTNAGTLGTNEAIYIAPDTAGSSNWTVVSDKTADSYWAGKHAFGGVASPTEDVYAVHGITGAYYKTNTNCSSTAAPAVCADAAAGSVTVAAAATTKVVNTTVVTANSQIILTRDNSLGTKLSATCNTQSSLVLGTPYVSARTAGTSFTIAIDVAPTTNPMCIGYKIIN